MNETLLPKVATKAITLDVKADKPFQIKHDLGRLPDGWLVIDQDNPVTVWRTGIKDTSVIQLIADNDARISLVLL
ncbi:hypothetical protein CI610_01747 [invertebrate metagenome]|uniref:Uncharacterized protein n=1 Tax=invertebrate metagenome TaxID=1711999 RepID=A0A2H9T7T3_9ZZZZ